MSWIFPAIARPCYLLFQLGPATAASPTNVSWNILAVPETWVESSLHLLDHCFNLGLPLLADSALSWMPTNVSWIIPAVTWLQFLATAPQMAGKSRAHEDHVTWLYYTPKKAEKSGHSKSGFGLSAAVLDRVQLTVGIFSFGCVDPKKLWQNRKCYIPKNAEKSGHSESGVHFFTSANSQPQLAKNRPLNSFFLNSGLLWVGKNRWCILTSSRGKIKHFQSALPPLNWYSHSPVGCNGNQIDMDLEHWKLTWCQIACIYICSTCSTTVYHYPQAYRYKPILQ